MFSDSQMNNMLPTLTIKGPANQQLRSELEVMEHLLPLDNAKILELGCGLASTTKQLAGNTKIKSILAAEVDPLAHKKNLQQQIQKVSFVQFGAENIMANNNDFDIVIMLKSLHHVPVQLMPLALLEVSRVLKPGGLAYISEPVFDGDYNEIIRMFHDEEVTRNSAFNAIKITCKNNDLKSITQVFYSNLVCLKSFEDFVKKVINISHTQHKISNVLMSSIQKKFENHKTESKLCKYRFEVPMRVNLLQKPSKSIETV